MFTTNHSAFSIYVHVELVANASNFDAYLALLCISIMENINFKFSKIRIGC